MSSKRSSPFSSPDVITAGVLNEKLVCIGSKEQLLPSELLHDTEITGDEMRLWSMLRNLAAQSAQDMPTQDALAKMINKSRPTVNTGLQMLRINRWITVIQEPERDNKGQFNQLVYAIHNFQMSIEQSVLLDPGYEQYLEEKSKGSSKRLRQRAIDTIKELKQLPHHNGAQLIINHSGNGLIIENPPCKDFLHGKHLPSSTSTSSSLLGSSVLSSSTVEVDEANSKGIGANLGVARDSGGLDPISQSVPSGDSENINQSVPSGDSENINQSGPLGASRDLGQSDTTGVSNGISQSVPSGDSSNLNQSVPSGDSDFGIPFFDNELMHQDTFLSSNLQSGTTVASDNPGQSEPLGFSGGIPQSAHPVGGGYNSLSVPSGDSSNLNQSAHTVGSGNLNQNDTQGVRRSEPKTLVEPEPENTHAQWHSYLNRLPQSLHKSVPKMAQALKLSPDEILQALKATLKRHENPDLPAVDNLPSYLKRMMRMARDGEIYDSEAEKAKTAKRHTEKKEYSIDQSINRRAMAVGITRHEGEDQAAFESRVNHEEYIKQMEGYGLAVDKKTGAVVFK